MAKYIPARLTPAEGRKFGFTVGAAFVAIALFLWWRQRHIGMQVTGTLGLLLLIGGLAAPTSLGPVQRAWMGLAHAISKVTTPIFMAVVYYLVLTPTGLLLRAIGRDPLTPPGSSDSRWAVRTPEEQRRNMNRQF